MKLLAEIYFSNNNPLESINLLEQTVAVMMSKTQGQLYETQMQADALFMLGKT